MARVAKRRDRYVFDYYDHQGKRVRKTLPKGTTKARAREILRGIEDQLAKGTYISEKKIPTFAEVARDWLEFKRPNLRDSTWSVYEGHTRNHFDEFNHLQINRITIARVERFIADRQRQDMNIATIRKLLVSLGQIMGYAVRHKYIDHNPVRDAEKPRGKGDVRDSEIRILNIPEIGAFLEAVSIRKYRVLFKLAISSGARQGELLGLKWTDLDRINNQIHIQRTFNNQAWYDTKTKTSNRRIDLGPSMMADLKEWRLACPPSKFYLVFPNNSGGPINHNNLVSRHFNPALERAGLPQIRFHDLRHTFASLLIEQGESTKYIQNQLGHSSPSVTLNVYAHLMKDTNQKSAKRLDETLFFGNRSQNGHKKQKRD